MIPDVERALLKECKGLGEVGVDIFCREAQAVWSELRPFAADKAPGAARRLGLGSNASKLTELAGDDDLSLVVAALPASRPGGRLRRRPVR